MTVFIKKTIYFSLILIAVFSIINISLAQESVSNSVSSLSLDISPNNPRPGDSVTLTVSSNLLDLSSSRIVWYIDGVARSETTSRSITVKAKDNGSKTEIRVVAQTSDGIIKETSGEIIPSGVDLIIEPIAYTPPFYKGKPLFLAEGIVKIIALPDITINGVKAQSKDLNFLWKKGEVTLTDSSGKGKNLIVLDTGIPVRDFTVDVQILDNSGNVLAENSKIISKNDPKLLFYEDSPLYGVLYNKAVVGNYYLGTKEELSIIAKPFFFSFLNDAPTESSYTWSVNGNPVSQNGKVNEITLRQTTTNTASTANISLDLKNNKRINQYVTNSFNVSFGQ